MASRIGRRPLRERISQKAALEKAWRSVRSGTSPWSAGADEITLGDFANSWSTHKTAIAEKLRCGQYVFGAYRGQPIPKTPAATREDPKGWRPVSIPNICDRVVQRAILNAIWIFLRDQVYTDTSFGGIRRYEIRSKKKSKGSALRPSAANEIEEDSRKCVQSAAKRVCDLRAEGYIWAFETDIENFYPSIDRELLLNRIFARLNGDDSINDLIKGALDTSVANAEQLGNLAKLWNPDDGVPQGGILSPMLANFYLFPLDKALSQGGLAPIRYVDDLIVFAKSKKDAERAHAICEEEIGRLKLSIHPLNASKNDRIKTKLIEPGQSFDFLGLTFDKHSIRPMGKKVAGLHQRIQDLTDFKKTSGKLPDVIGRINNCTTGWITSYRFCNLGKADLNEIDSLVMHCMRRWLRFRGLIRSENHLTEEAYSWLGIKKAAETYINPILPPTIKPR